MHNHMWCVSSATLLVVASVTGALLQSLHMTGELTKRRLHCWLEEPARRMELLAELLCRCEGLKVCTLHCVPLFCFFCCVVASSHQTATRVLHACIGPLMSAMQFPAACKMARGGGGGAACHFAVEIRHRTAAGHSTCAALWSCAAMVSQGP